MDFYSMHNTSDYYTISLFFRERIFFYEVELLLRIF